MLKFSHFIKIHLRVLSVVLFVCFSAPFSRVFAENLPEISETSISPSKNLSESPEIFISPSETLPELYISAINPGYTENGVQNVGELIVLSRRTQSYEADPSSAATSDFSGTPLSLAGLSISYTNSSGNETNLVQFPEHTWMTGEFILLRLASSPGSELANQTYTKTLAFKGGPLILKRGNEILDSICWTGGDACLAPFRSAEPTVLVRDKTTGLFRHVPKNEYETPPFNEAALIFEPEEETALPSASKCRGLMFSEVLSYYETMQDEQFVEFYNSTSEQLSLDGCTLRYKNQVYPLSGVLAPEAYYARFATDFKLTKNPASSNLLELLDADGSLLDTLVYPNGQRKGTAYAFIGYDDFGEELWRLTYAATPGAPNNYQEFKTCETGKIINEATGNCVKVTSISEKICGEGQFLNLLTGRCKKVEVATVKTCNEGYYLNPETNRCKKIQENSGISYALTPEEYEEKSSFTAIYLIAGLIVAGLIYLLFEFRTEIIKFFKKIISKSHN